MSEDLTKDFPDFLQPNDIDKNQTNLYNSYQQTSELDMLISNITAKPQNELIVRGSWSQQEDALLQAAVNHFGQKKWMEVAKFVPTRTSKQCRERWIQRLAPNIKKEMFEPWEDQIILEKQSVIGNRWTIIAQSLPGRTSGSIKNRWYSFLKNQKVIPDQSNYQNSIDLDLSIADQNINVSNNGDL